jgi:hypothetical protein
LIRLLLSLAAYLIANAVGLLAAILLLPGFQIDLSGFLIAVGIFSAFQTLAGPLVTKISLRHMPQLVGGIALVTVFFGLIITDALVVRMDVGGVANLLAATLLVWLGSLIAAILLPLYVFKQLRKTSKEDEVENDANRAAAAAERAVKAAEAAQAGKTAPTQSAQAAATAANPPPNFSSPG